MKSIKSLSILFAACLAMSFAACEKGSDNGGNGGNGGNGTDGGGVTPDYTFVAQNEVEGLITGISALHDTGSEMYWTTVQKMAELGMLVNATTKVFSYNSEKKIIGGKFMITLASEALASQTFQMVQNHQSEYFKHATATLQGNTIIVATTDSSDFDGQTCDNVKEAYEMELESIKAPIAD